MKKKWSILVLSFFILFSIPFGLFTHIQERIKQNKHANRDGPYFQLFNITRFSYGGLPCINIEIEDEQIEAEIDLGSNAGLRLASDTLGKIKRKKFVHMSTSMGARGKKYQSNCYEIPEIKLGRAKLSRLQADELNVEFQKDALVNPEEADLSVFNSSKIGCTFFCFFNLYMDCKQSTIAIADSIETLQENGCLLDYIEIPLVVIGWEHIGFEATTESGPLLCMLDTGCTFNLLNLQEGEAFEVALR